MPHFCNWNPLIAPKPPIIWNAIVEWVWPSAQEGGGNGCETVGSSPSERKQHGRKLCAICPSCSVLESTECRTLAGTACRDIRLNGFPAHCAYGADFAERNPGTTKSD